MSLQEERISGLCDSLKLSGIGTQWNAEAQAAARNETSFADFLERLLEAENAARDQRRVSTLTKLATMPVIKTLETFDWKAAAGAPKAQIIELSHGTYIERAESLVSAHGGPEYEQLQSNGAVVLQLHRWDTHEHPFLGNPTIKPYGNGVVLWFMCENVEATYERPVKAGGEVLESLHVNPLASHLEFWLREPNGYVVVVAGSYGQLGSFEKSVA